MGSHEAGLARLPEVAAGHRERPWFLTREGVLSLPRLVYYGLFSWLYPTRILRLKAAATPYGHLRLLLLRRSGIRIGEGTSIQFGTMILGAGRQPPAVALGDRVAVAPYVCFVTSSSPGASRLTGLPEVRAMIRPFGPIRVEDDAWIGAGAIIFPGVAVGCGAIVGAGAVVIEDVPPHAIVAGVPARLIRRLAVEDDGPDIRPAPPIEVSEAMRAGARRFPRTTPAAGETPCN